MVEVLRKITRFSLAAFLWLHTFFLLNLPHELLAKLSVWLHLTAIETILFTLLVVFAFVAGKGFWSGVGNVAYVYFFPFVLFFYVCVGTFYALRAFARVTNGTSERSINQRKAVESSASTLPVSSESSHPKSIREELRKVSRVLLRPLKKFTVLWCLVLVTTTHTWILWAALVLVLLHLGRAAYLALRISFFSGGWFGEFEKIIHKNVDEWVTKLHSVTRESSPSPVGNSYSLGKRNSFCPKRIVSVEVGIAVGVNFLWICLRLFCVPIFFRILRNSSGICAPCAKLVGFSRHVAVHAFLCECAAAECGYPLLGRAAMHFCFGDRNW
jgi:hypothetical protein